MKDIKVGDPDFECVSQMRQARKQIHDRQSATALPCEVEFENIPADDPADQEKVRVQTARQIDHPRSSADDDLLW